MGKQTGLAWNTNRIQAMLWLRNAFPLLFSSHVKPLKIGIKEDITNAGLDGMPEEKWVSVAIGHYVRSNIYLRCMKEGVDRFDLQGLPSGDVTHEAAAKARETVSLRQKKWNEAARQVKLVQKAVKEKMTAETIQTTPAVNNVPDVAYTKRTLTLKKKSTVDV